MGDIGKIVSFIINIILLVVFVVLLVCYFVIKKEEVITHAKPVSFEQIIPIKERYYEDMLSGAAAYQFQGDHLDSPYFTMNDYYNMKSSGSLRILSNFRTYQQTSGYTCGCCCLIMAMDYVAHDTSMSEKECAYLSDTGTDIHDNPIGGGAYLTNLTHVLDEKGYEYVANEIGLEDAPFEDYVTFKDWVIDSINNGWPIIVCSNDWAGHYTIIIGIDTMGTDGDDETYDDVIIMADPFDTTDHRQDGYNVWGLERFFDFWGVTITLFPESLRPYSMYRFIQVKGKRQTN